jgi:hypothetical protein
MAQGKNEDEKAFQLDVILINEYSPLKSRIFGIVILIVYLGTRLSFWDACLPEQVLQKFLIYDNFSHVNFNFSSFDFDFLHSICIHSREIKKILNCILDPEIKIGNH